MKKSTMGTEDARRFSNTDTAESATTEFSPISWTTGRRQTLAILELPPRLSSRRSSTASTAVPQESSPARATRRQSLFARRPSLAHSIANSLTIDNLHFLAEQHASRRASCLERMEQIDHKTQNQVQIRECRGNDSAALAKTEKRDGDVASNELSLTPSHSTSDSTKAETKSELPYHVFSRAKKRRLVYIVALAGLFSPLSSNIYFPALGDISRATGTSVEMLSLTITVYMIVQGLAPAFWAPLSDTRGRRITLLGTFAVYLISNVGLAFSRDFVQLMIWRSIQAAGSAATVALSAGVVGDITTAKERGGLVGLMGGIRTMGQSFGPVLGGIITQVFGYRAIFWFLFILGVVALLLILAFLPETLRCIAGNGTVRLHGIHRPLFYKYDDSLGETAVVDSESLPRPEKMTLASIFAPMRFLVEKDVFITLLFGAVVYAVWSMVTSSTTALFQRRFGLSDLQVGLVFLPNGAGCVLGSYLTGWLMDRDYRVVEAQYRTSRGLEPDTTLDRKCLADFPVEKSRLRSIWWITALFVLATGGYGFSLTSSVLVSVKEQGTPVDLGIAVPLVLQFVIAYTAQAVFSINSALVIDLYPGASASATAVNNLMRCGVGAAGVALVPFAIDGLGAGMAFLVFALVTAGLSPLLFLELRWGERWRRARMERAERKKQPTEAVDLEK